MRKFEILLICCIVLCCASVSAQQFRNSDFEEWVSVVVDRSVYIAGERINFSAVQYSKSSQNGNEGTKTLFAELITPDGMQMMGSKYLLIENKAQGCIKIPADITTGVYYLRAYTGQMLKEGPSIYAYTELKIINPSKEDVIPGKGGATPSVPVFDTAFGKSISRHIRLICDRAVYQVRDTVHVKLEADLGMMKEFSAMSLAVVPEFSVTDSQKVIPQSIGLKENIEFNPESRGILLTGKLVDANKNEPLAGVMVNLSIIGQGRDFMAVRTDARGGFYFSLPNYTGKRDLFICAEKLPGYEAKILVDNDFCTRPVQMPSPVFDLTEKERNTAYQMALNTLVHLAFSPDTVSIGDESAPNDRPFYGKPSEILYLDQYIQLPTLEEYFNELPLTVKVRKRKGEKYFKVFGQKNELDVFDPLVLIDHVAVDDAERILKVSPQNVARIEVVNEPYVKGSQTYGGIISIISKRGDFAGIDLPSSGVFISYRFLEEEANCDPLLPSGTDTPDTRNTLFWQPLITPDKEGKAETVFTTADSRGSYKAVLSVILSSGKTFMVSTGFTVK